MIELKKILNGESKAEIIITWRLFFYLFISMVTTYFILHAIERTYENRIIAGMVFLLYISNIILSIFLVSRR